MPGSTGGCALFDRASGGYRHWVVSRRGYLSIAAAAVAAASIAFALITASSGPSAGVRGPAGAARTIAARPMPGRSPSGSLAACERRLPGRDGPVLVIVGASFTAGAGPGSPSRSWAVLLARSLRWNAVVYGVSGAGYVSRGNGDRGPVSRLLERADLRGLAPSLVIIQAGHDDIGVPAGLERQRVRQAIGMIRSQAPGARIALVTVFAGRSDLAAAHRTDRVIVAAATAADPHVIIIDPLALGWRFARVPGGLHPTAGGDAWIARAVGAVLRKDGVRPGAGIPGICDSGIPQKAPGSSRVELR